jgi:DNA-binding transcriptional LysR family regulator
MIDARNLNRLAYFAAVVDTGSFTAAAERLGITKAVVSQQVARLERELGTTLLVRTTRRMAPTEAGRSFHARCTLILREAEDAFDELGQAATEPTGLLRLTAPYDYGTAMVVPAVTEFTCRHPGCTAEILLSDQRLDLAGGRLDLAIRVGWVTEPGLQARRIGGFRQLLVAGAGHAGAAAMEDPAEVARLRFVALTALRDPLTWQLTRGKLERRVIRFAATIATDTSPAVLAAVMAGAGLGVLPDFLVGPLISEGRLHHVLPQWTLPAGGIHAVFPAQRYRPARVRAFVDLLARAEQTRSG